MPRPQLWIIAGPNGAGKTSLVSESKDSLGLPEDAFINPDAITLSYLQEQGIESWKEAPPEVLKETFIRAANDAERLLEARMETGGIAVVESVLSTTKYCKLVERVRELGGELKLIYVALKSAELSKARVGLRVLKGGHDVPADKLDARWKKSLELLPWFAFRADEFWIIDNSEQRKVTGGHLLVSGSHQVLHLHGIPEGDLRAAMSEFLTKFTELNSAGTWSLDLGDRYELP